MARARPKVAIFHCGFAHSGGGERIVIEEAIGLRELGYEVVCFAPTLDRELCYPDLIRGIRARTFLPQLPVWFPLRNMAAAALSSLLAPLLSVMFLDVDVFVGANQPGAWIAYCVSRVLGKPYIVYANQPNRLIYPRPIDRQTDRLTKKHRCILNAMFRPIRRLAGWADRASFGNALVTLANGTYVKGVIDRIYDRRSTSCPAGCHPQPLGTLRLNPHTALEGSLVIGGKQIPKPYVLITNRHEPQKKSEYVIEAMRAVLEEFPAASLLIPGPFTRHTPRLISLARRHGISEKVHFLGQISEDDLQRLYQEAAVYCYPAPQENFGMGVIEAMAWGVPVVAWRHSELKAPVQDGVSGFLAEPHRVEDLSRAILALLRSPDLRARMGRAARARAEEFSWRRHVRILESALMYALAQPSLKGEAIPQEHDLPSAASKSRGERSAAVEADVEGFEASLKVAR